MLMNILKHMQSTLTVLSNIKFIYFKCTKLQMYHYKCNYRNIL